MTTRQLLHEIKSTAEKFPFDPTTCTRHQGTMVAASLKHVAKPGVRIQVRIIGLAAMVGVALIAAFAAPTSATASPGCPEFTNPKTGACEPSVIPAPPPAAPAPAGSAAEQGFLNEVRPARLPYTDANVLKLGYRICQVFDPSMPGGDTVHQVAAATGISLAMADAFDFAALKYLCPEKYPYR
jgi:hypothetical protein